MPTATSFPPITRRDARALILGSMPGRESLMRGEYYAHPRNAFWYLMGELFGAEPDLAYTARMRRLREQRVAVWDVLRECRRVGSLDSAIDTKTESPNDLAAFLARHKQLHAIFFNGRKAEAAFRRHVLRDMKAEARLDGIVLTTLPSTSPAYASLSWEDKLVRWRVVVEAVAFGCS